MGYPPNECLLIGDAEKDVGGGKPAGMKVATVTNSYTRESDFSAADAVFSSMGKVTVFALETLMWKEM